MSDTIQNNPLGGDGRDEGANRDPSRHDPSLHDLSRHDLSRHDLAADKLINRILDAEAEGEVLEVRDLVRAGEAGLPEFRARLGLTRETLGELSLFPKGPDLTARILAKVEASSRPFVVEAGRRRASRTRLAVACAALGLLTSVAIVERLWPEAISLTTSPRPVTDLVSATRSDLTVTVDSIRGAFQRVGADISAPMAELTQIAGTGQAARPRVAGALGDGQPPERMQQRRGHVAIALMPLPTEELRLADPGVVDWSSTGGALAMEGAEVYQLEAGLARGVVGTTPVGGNVDVSRMTPEARMAMTVVSPMVALVPARVRGDVAAGKPLAKARPRPPLMLLSESSSTCAFDRVPLPMITEAMVRGENPHTLDWLGLDLSEPAEDAPSESQAPKAPR